MKITKYLHSCLLIADQGKVILIDPGQYTYDAQVLPLSTLSQLDYLLVTHEHADHFSIAFIKEILNKFPDISIISNQSVVDLLQKEGIQATVEETDSVKLESVPHENVFGIQVPPNVLFHVFDQLTHPGDSFHVTNTKQILALPMQAPWGHLTEAMALAVRLKPEYIIPTHDWHWKDEVRKGLYQRAEQYLKGFGIIFKGLETGEIVVI